MFVLTVLAIVAALVLGVYFAAKIKAWAHKEESAIGARAKAEATKLENKVKF